MKKVFASAVVGLALGAVSAVSALDMSVGGGGFFASDFGGQGTISKGSYDDWGENGEILGKVQYEGRMSFPWLGGGANLFFDVTYAEIGLGLTFAGGNPHVYEKEGSRDTSFTYKDISISTTNLNISVLGKYPVPLGDNMSIYPAVGIDYALCLAGQTKSKNNEIGKEEVVKWDGKKETITYGEGEYAYTYERENPKAMDFSQLWVKFGIGYDHGLTDAVFLRAQALYGIGFASKMINDEIKEKSEYTAALSHGLTIKVGVGYKF